MATEEGDALDMAARERREKRRKEKEREERLRRLAEIESQKGRKTNIDKKDLMDEDMDGAEELELDLVKVDYRYSFVKRGGEMDRTDLQWWIDRLQRRYRHDKAFEDKAPLMRGLEKGVGLHHEGLKLHYRHIVQTMFRCKHVRIVFTSASLAMGVNMPARTVVFAGDDPHLNPLTYRQMMGRAGRRGYDHVGNVVFYGIAPRKVSYLMTSQLTSLTGHYPLTNTLPVKAMDLYRGYSESKDYALGIFRNFFTPPFGDRKARITSEQIKYLFRCSLDYQIHNGFIRPTGNLSGFGGLVSYLHVYEPENFAFAKVLESGKLHEICKGYKALRGDLNSSKKRIVQSQLLFILCHIFLRIPVPVAHDPHADAHACLTLPSLGDQNVQALRDIDIILQKHRMDTASMFSNYFRNYRHFSKRGRSDRLPLSSVRVQPPRSSRKDEANEKQLVGALESLSNSSPVRSSFSSVSGITDVLTSTPDFIESFGRDMPIPPSSLPLFESLDLRGRNLRLNAFVFDFFMHGDYRRIIKENNIRDGLAWEHLKKFDILLKLIKEALQDVSDIPREKKKLQKMVERKIVDLERLWKKVSFFVRCLFSTISKTKKNR